METEEQELRKLEKSAIKQWFGLLVGLGALFLLIIDAWQLPSIIILGVLGVISTVAIIYLWIPGEWKWKGFLKKVSKVAVGAQMEHTTWLIALGALGISLTQRECIILKILGLILAFSGIAIFIYCTSKGVKRR